MKKKYNTFFYILYIYPLPIPTSTLPFAYSTIYTTVYTYYIQHYIYIHTTYYYILYIIIIYSL